MPSPQPAQVGCEVTLLLCQHLPGEDVGEEVSTWQGLVLCLPLQGGLTQCQREKRASVFKALQTLSKRVAGPFTNLVFLNLRSEVRKSRSPGFSRKPAFCTIPRSGQGSKFDLTEPWDLTFRHPSTGVSQLN